MVPILDRLKKTSILRWLPSGKRLHNYGKSPFFYGKINYFDWAIFYVANCKRLPGRVTHLLG